jgi:steroid delta-isomerase-like uncharacterized protein
MIEASDVATNTSSPDRSSGVNTPHADAIVRAPSTRRPAVAGLSAALLGASLGRARAQEATPAALPTAMSEWVAGWQSLDADRIAAIYTDAAVHEVVATGETIEGRAAIRDNVAAIMEAIPDATLAVNGAFAAGDFGAIDWTFMGHYSVQMPGFPPPAGQALAFRAATIFEMTGDQVIRTSEFYDLYGLLVQLGALPAPGGPATPAG